MKRLIPILIAVIASLAIPSMASAWTGATVQPLSCPEIHFRAGVERGDWNIQARLGRVTGDTLQARYASFLALPFVTDSTGAQVLNRNVTGSDVDQVIGGFYLPTAAPTVVTVAVGNAANLADGFTYRTSTMTNCAAPPSSPPSVVERTTTIVQRIEVPVPPVEASCISNRTIRWYIRPNYPGSRNRDGLPVIGIDRTKVGPTFRGVSAGRGIYTGFDSDGKVIETTVRKVTSGKYKGRFRATIHAKGHRFTGFNNSLRATVWIKNTAGTFRTSYFADVCRNIAGNPNDQRSRSPEIPG